MTVGMGRRVPVAVTVCPQPASSSCSVVVTMRVHGRPWCCPSSPDVKTLRPMAFSASWWRWARGALIIVDRGVTGCAVHARGFVVGVAHARRRPFREHGLQCGAGFGIEHAADRAHAVGLLVAGGQVSAAGPVGVGEVAVRVYQCQQPLGGFAERVGARHGLQPVLDAQCLRGGQRVERERGEVGSGGLESVDRGDDTSSNYRHMQKVIHRCAEARVRPCESECSAPRARSAPPWFKPSRRQTTSPSRPGSTPAIR